MNTFKNLVKEKTDYKYNPVSQTHKTGMTARYRKFLKDNKGAVPITEGFIYNPKTERIVMKNRFQKSKYSDSFDVVEGDGFTYLSNEVSNFEEKLQKHITGESYKNGITIKFSDYSENVLTKIIQKLGLNDENFVITAGDKYYVVNDRTINNLIDTIKQSSTDEVITQGSDGEIITAIQNYDSFTIKKWSGKIEGFLMEDDDEEGQTGLNPNGFFPYFHNIPDLDLSKYGIFRKDQEKNYDNCCIVEALIQSKKLTQGKINILKQKVNNRFINQRDLEEFAKSLKGLCIQIKRIDTNKQKENEEEGKKKNQAKNHIYPKGSKSKEKIKIGSVCGHAFHIDKDTGITGWALRNIDTPEFKSLLQYNKRGQCDPKRCIDSFEVIDYLYLHKDRFLTKITKCDEIYNSVFYDKITEFETLDYGEESIKQIEYKDKDELEEWKIEKGFTREQTAKIFFDFETDVYLKAIEGKKEKTSRHTPYIVCCETDPHIQKYIEEKTRRPMRKSWVITDSSKDVGYQFLEYLYEWFSGQEEYNLKLYAHNLGYDFRFLAPYVKVGGGINIEKGTSQIITTTAEFLPFGLRKKGKGARALKIEFFDTLALIPSTLRNFGKMFELNTKKEILPYEMYNSVNIKRKYLDEEVCLSYIQNDEDKKEFINNCNEWDCFINGKINIIKYSVKYCLMDCVVLRDGYYKFQSLIKEATGLNSEYYLTLPSIASDFLKKEGCFDGCYSIAGIPRDFIAESAWGGRVMCKNNEKQLLDFRNDSTKNITDLDEVSQYPSSMARMEGFVKGTPKIITEWNENNSYDMFYIRIEITKVGKYLDFPLLNYKDPTTGVRDYTNDMVGKRITIDKYTFEDLIHFHKIEYKFINGYFFDEGFNNKINTTIRKLFYTRFQAKHQIKKIGGTNTDIRKIPLESIKEGLRGNLSFDDWIETQYDKETEEIYKNPLQEVLKLIMNSAYGKMLLKPIDTSLHYVAKGKVKHHFKKHYYQIKSFEKEANGQYCKFTHYEPIDEHFNQVHIGANVLSIAKRMMMEVMTIGQELNMSPSYTDTDSIQIVEQFVEPIREEYNSRYGKFGSKYYIQKDMLGEDLGQFNLDLEIKGCNSVVSNYAIWLGKKCYIHKLEGVHNKTGEKVLDYHIRMKGVPSNSIKWKSKSEYKNDTMKIYEELYHDTATSIMKNKKGKMEEVKGQCFDLLKDKDGSLKVRFEFNGDMTITTKQDFVRKIRFPNKDEN